MSNEFIVETSARHVHVTKEAMEVLFGKDVDLTVKKYLSQPGQFASNEKVTVVGTPKVEGGEPRTCKCSILGPYRKACQVELSATDARQVGIKAPIRESGDIAGSGACKLVGPAGELELKEGVIIAKRHIHLTPEDTKELGVENGEVVWVKIDTPDRKAVLGDVVCRVSENYKRAMHIDTDEANAIGAVKDMKGSIVKL